MIQELESMSDERVVDKVITTFHFNTCRLRLQPRKHAGEAAMLCASVASPPNVVEDVKLIPLTTGSVAEFYIEPMLPHVGDVDVMVHFDSELAIQRGHPPPTQLSAEFSRSNNVRVFEIIDSHWSGYVYLELRYLLTKCTVSGTYNNIEYKERGFHLHFVSIDGVEMHGPAELIRKKYEHQLSVDMVYCVRCLSWPLQASNWPLRHKNNGWPDSATIDYIVSDGCVLVQIAHRQCKRDKWMSTHQWRLSFSRAEIILLNSWMPVQQIVYHCLRVFAKIELLTESANHSEECTLSNYHIKTLMLWACELKPNSWWTDNVSFVRICAELLNTLAHWLIEQRCPHYFINNCNLVDKSFALKTAADRLLSIDMNYMLSWFVTRYIRQSVQICPKSVSRLFDDVSTSAELENAVSAVVDWRLNSTIVDLCREFYSSQYNMAIFLDDFSISAQLYSWISELQKTDARLVVYLIALVFLHIVQKIGSSGLTEHLLSAAVAVTTTLLVSSNYCNKRTFTLLNKVIILARQCQTQAVNSANSNTSELVELLLQSAVELLTVVRHFEAREFGSIVEIVTTDFEALYAYKHGDYQRCLQLSTQNVHTLLHARHLLGVPVLPVYIQLLDDDIVSLIALTLIVNPKCRDHFRHATINQLTLSLYLMTQCQLKLRHSVTSLAQTFYYIKASHDTDCFTMNRLTLNLIERKLMTYISILCRQTVL